MAVWSDLAESCGFWIGAHRGGMALGPENTLETAMLGFQCGAHFWELDVQLSADGVPVVIHDKTLQRTTDAPSVYPKRRPWHVWDFTQAELESLGACSRRAFSRNPARGPAPLKTSPLLFSKDPVLSALLGKTALNAPDPASRPGAFQNVSEPKVSAVCRIPTLREALDMTRRLQWLVNVEIKGKAEHRDRLVQETLALITELDMVPRVLVSSFHLDVLYRVRALHDQVKIGVLVKEAVSDPVQLVRDVKAYALHPARRHLRREAVRRCREAGIPVIAWTVNDSAEARRLQDWGASAVISDRPQELIGQKQSKEDAPSW